MINLYLCGPQNEVHSTVPSYILEDTRQFYVTANGQLHSTPICHEAHPGIAGNEDEV